MDQDDLLRHVVRACETLGLRYFVTGSMATIFYGEPRFTNDIDVVVDLPAEAIPRFAAKFPPNEFYLSEESVRHAVRRRSQFNVIHPASGLKIDVMIPAGDAFDRSRFARTRTLHPAPDLEAVFASPEDVIVKKMAFYLDGGSEKHLRDIAGVLDLGADEIDRRYIADWAERLDLQDVWREILERIDEKSAPPGLTPR